jgi:hypothetical protein
MKNSKLKWIRIMAIAVIVLGCIHLCATPIVMKGLQNAPIELKFTFLLMFLIAGLGTLFPGVIILFQFGNNVLSKNSWTISLVCSIYFLIIGGLAVVLSAITGGNNPFAYIALLLGVLLFIPLMNIRQQCLA